MTRAPVMVTDEFGFHVTDPAEIVPLTLPELRAR
jgi:hypothetical protein